MDIAFFSQMLKSLDNKQDIIRNTVQYCWANKALADNIMKMMEKEFGEARRDKRIVFFYVMNDLLQNSSSAGDLNFVKAIGAKIKPMITDFIKVNGNINDVGALVKLIQRWNSDQIFASNFTTKLRDIINPTYKKLLDLAEQEQSQKQLMKYNKTFLVDYMTIQQFEPTRNQYEDFIAWTDISTKINKFNQEYKKLDNEQLKNRSDELLRIGEDYKNQLVKLVQSLHVHYKVLADKCRQEMTIIKQTGPGQSQ